MDRLVHALYALVAAPLSAEGRATLDAELDAPLADPLRYGVTTTIEVARRPPSWWGSDEQVAEEGLALARQFGLGR